MVGIIPALAAAVIDGDMLRRAMTLNKGFMGFLDHEGFRDTHELAETPQLRGEPGRERLLLSVARPGQLERLFDELSSCPRMTAPAPSAPAASAWCGQRDINDQIAPILSYRLAGMGIWPLASPVVGRWRQCQVAAVAPC